MNPILHIESLVHGYGARPVLDDVDLELPAGEFVVLIGPNGAGKTTLLQCVSGVLTPRAGRIRIGGVDLRTDPMAARQRLGMAIEPHKLPPLLTPRECLHLFAGARGLPTVPDSTWTLCDALALTPLLDRQVDQGSLGLRQKLGIALGLLGEPPLLLLDEPLNGLDPLSAHALKQHLQRRCREHGACCCPPMHWTWPSALPRARCCWWTAACAGAGRRRNWRRSGRRRSTRWSRP